MGSCYCIGYCVVIIKHFGFFIFLLLNNIAFSNTCCSAVDSKGYKVSLTKPAKRIVALAPNLTEMIFSIGAGRRLVGVSSASDYPKSALLIPRVATYSGLDLEKIVFLNPDLVLAWKNGTSDMAIKSLKNMKFPVYIAGFKKISDISKTLLAFGVLTGHEKQARRVAYDFRLRHLSLKRKYIQRRKVSVFYQLSLFPLITLNHFSLINQAINICGGRNIFADLIGIAPRVSLEDVLIGNPKVIIMSKQSMYSKLGKNYWQHFPRLLAVRQNNVFTINSDILERYGPRMIFGIEQLCHYIDTVRYNVAN